MTDPIQLGRLTFTLGGLALAAAAVLWGLLALLSVIWWRRSSGIRATEVLLIVSTLLFAGVWYVVKPGAAAPAAAASTSVCFTIPENAPVNDVKRILGNPSHIQDEEQMRGPGAEVWIYENKRCAVHLLNDAVDYVD